MFWSGDHALLWVDGFERWYPFIHPLSLNTHIPHPTTRLLGSFVEDGYEACLLIFPEGTTVNTRTFDKSRAFAAGKQRPELNHLVLPRCVPWINRSVVCGVVVCCVAGLMGRDRSNKSHATHNDDNNNTASRASPPASTRSARRGRPRSSTT